MNELELILTDIFNCSRSDLYLNYASAVFTDKEFIRLDKILRERGRIKPLQYILGYAEFMGLRFKVNRDVLIPRPETEILVEAVIERTLNLKLENTEKVFFNANFRKSNANHREYIEEDISDHSRLISGNSRSRRVFQRSQLQNSKISILDIGTGSGCIAISLAKRLENAKITATDISKEALCLARDNAKLRQAEDRIRFLQSDLFGNEFFKTGIKFDIIVSNPPYVPTSEIGIFDKTTLKEPKIALDGGNDGLDFYRRIEKESEKFLEKGGFLIMELGFGQAERIKEIFKKCWIIEQFKKDYQNIERVCIIRKDSLV